MQNICRALHPFCNVTVVKIVRFIRLALYPVKVKGTNPAAVTKPVVNRIYCDFPIKLLFIGYIPARNFHLIAIK